MVNGNYVLYGDRPSSESEIVDDHVQTRTAERKNKRKFNRNANELQRTLNMAQLDNETDSVKYEKKIKEPKLLRYVPTSDVKENFITEKFETYDLTPSEERPRRYGFQKKPRNPTDGSVNYAYSRSSSSCSSPNANLPTISEHSEHQQYGTYRVQSLPPNCAVGDIINSYENKMDKYFTKPKTYGAKVGYEGSHPDSLYRVQPTVGVRVGRMKHALRVLRWPLALVTVCVALALFVYFLMPENMDSGATNSTYWEPIIARTHGTKKHAPTHTQNNPESTVAPTTGTKTPEIDFYDAETEKSVQFSKQSVSDSDINDSNAHRVLPIEPVYPTYIAPEVQYGNEKADTKKLRTAKVLAEVRTLPDDSTFKPHITQKPEKPLAVYFKDLNEAPTTETMSRAETVNEFTTFGEKQTTKTFEVPLKSYTGVYKEQIPVHKIKQNIQQYLVEEPELPQENSDYSAPNANFTSGHSKIFGISIEHAEKMRSTTQSSLYNTRVSPTLPTWRDGADATTKKYPMDVNYEVAQCRSTRLALCRDVLPYDLAGAPAAVDGLDPASLLTQLEYLIAANCSDRTRQFACAFLEPECNPPGYPPKMPCYNLCKAISDSCYNKIPSELAALFTCARYPVDECVIARAPCGARELTCGDGSCVPRDWMCDGNNDCPDGEDELSCHACNDSEYRCSSGGCIIKRWVCDGYADCPRGEDESNCALRETDLGEDTAGSAPAASVRRPNRIPAPARVEDTSKELLVTSDSSSVFRRNYTRLPPSSRLIPYSHSVPTTTESHIETQSTEDTNMDGFFEDLKKLQNVPPTPTKRRERPARKPISRVTTTAATTTVLTRLDKSMNKLEKVLDGAALMKKAQEEQDRADASETKTTAERDEYDDGIPELNIPGSSHLSPCPSGELRCVDGRCITLAQLCDGTVDCTDHADEDNCYT